MISNKGDGDICEAGKNDNGCREKLIVGELVGDERIVVVF